MTQRCHRLRQRLLRHHPPASARHRGEACQHGDPLAVGNLPGAAVQRRQLVDQCIAFHHRTDPLAVWVIEQASVAIDYVEVRPILVEVFAQQAVENVAFAQVKAATDVTQVVAMVIEYRLRQGHHQVVGR
ncbi:hypothetical protein D3C78_1566120 [compost metagenome]